MEKYIPLDALVAEIEKFKENANKRGAIGKVSTIVLCNEFLSFIDTLEVKEVNLEKEIDKEWNKCEPTDEGMGLEIASIEYGQLDNITKHFFELGIKAQKL